MILLPQGAADAVWDDWEAVLLPAAQLLGAAAGAKRARAAVEVDAANGHPNGHPNGREASPRKGRKAGDTTPNAKSRPAAEAESGVASPKADGKADKGDRDAALESRLVALTATLSYPLTALHGFRCDGCQAVRSLGIYRFHLPSSLCRFAHKGD